MRTRTEATIPTAVEREKRAELAPKQRVGFLQYSQYAPTRMARMAELMLREWKVGKFAPGPQVPVSTSSTSTAGPS